MSETFERWLSENLGRRVTLPIRRFGPAGAFLGIDDDDDGKTVLMLGHEIAEGARTGDPVDVYVYLDSQDRPMATRRVPKLSVAEVTFLEIKELTPIGAFADFGLPKQLLVPFAEQTRKLVVGERHPIGLVVDDSLRLVGTMQVSEMLRDRGSFQVGDWVDGEAYRNEPEIGLFVILGRRHLGLLPKSEPHSLGRGQAARFRVSHVLPDGKVELSLRRLAHEERGSDAAAILRVLSSVPTPKVGDRSTPDEIRDLFGLSKKAFKRAAGHLLKQGAIDIDSRGNFHVRTRR